MDAFHKLLRNRAGKRSRRNPQLLFIFNIFGAEENDEAAPTDLIAAILSEPAMRACS